jgi:hypothetical protein
VFNVDHKYTPNNFDKAVFMYSNGFSFGHLILLLTGNMLNNNNEGRCLTGKSNYYHIEGDVSPLTGEKEKFTCAELELYQVIY